MCLVALLNAGIAILQGSFYGLAGIFPGGFISNVVSGQGIAGVAASLLMIASLMAGGEEPVTTGIIYFILADVFIVFTIFMYLDFRRWDLYELANTSEIRTTDPENETTWADYLSILRKIKWMGFTLGLCLCITLSIYPATQSYITSASENQKATWVYFQPGATFLVFNMMDVIGRETSRVVQWPSHKGASFHILASLRVLFIPLILLCHGDNKTFPTLFNHDAYYIVFNALFAFSNGYFGSLAMVYYPKLLSIDEVEIGATVMASLMGVGMVMGSTLSPAFVWLWGPS